MKTLIFVVGFVILVLVLGFGTTMVAFKGMFLLGRVLLPQHPATIMLILSLGLAILARIGTRAMHNYSMRKLREKGVPEPPESERRAIRVWTRATLATIFVVLLGIVWHGIRFWAKATALTILVVELIRLTIHRG